MPEAPGGGHKTQLCEPDETAPLVEPVELLRRPPPDPRPEEPPPDPNAAVARPLPVAPVPVALVAAEFAPPAGWPAVATPLALVERLVVEPLAVVGLAGVDEPALPIAGSTTALPLRGELLLPPEIDGAVCAAAEAIAASDARSMRAGSRIMRRQREPQPRVPNADFPNAAPLLRSPCIK
jgi:hypothetical protein